MGKQKQPAGAGQVTHQSGPLGAETIANTKPTGKAKAEEEPEETQKIVADCKDSSQ